MIPEDEAQNPETNSVLLDVKAIRRRFDRAAQDSDEVNVLGREIGSRLTERLELLRIAPQNVLDLGSGTGWVAADLLARYRKAQVYAIDLSPQMLVHAARRGKWLRRIRPVCADTRRLPLKDASIDLVVSNLMLPWCHPLDEVFREVRRVLSPGGAFIFSTLGPDTLAELRQAWSQVDGNPHVHSFLDMHDVGDALLHAGLVDPVMDAERLCVTYSDVSALLRELRQLGVSNVLKGRAKGLTSRAAFRALEAAYPRDSDGRIAVTGEIVYGLAWGSGSVQEKREGEVRIGLWQLRSARGPS